jgi:hypothetical protein
MADLVTGEVAPTRQRLADLLDDLAPVARRMGCASELARADLDANGATRQRAVDGGPHEVTAWLAGRFLG